MSARAAEQLASGGDPPGLRPERIQLLPAGRAGRATAGAEGAAERRRPLSAKAAKAYLAALPHWRLAANGRSIHRRLQFSSHTQAVMFVNLALGLAALAGLDLEITIRADKVSLWLPAPRGGGWTAEVLDFARSLEGASELGG